MFDFCRIACVVPECRTADIDYNVHEVVKLYREAVENEAAVVLFPAEVLTGYGCGDLLNSTLIARKEREALTLAARCTIPYTAAMVFSLSNGKAAVLCNGNINIVSGTDTVFTNGNVRFAAVPGRNSFEEVKNPGNAQILLFPGAGTDTPDTITLRRMDYICLSRTLNTYCVYSGPGVTNSTARGVCGGQAFISFDGKVTGEIRQFSDLSQHIYYQDIDITFSDFMQRQRSVKSDGDFTEVNVRLSPPSELQYYPVSRYPFIPQENEADYCRDLIRLAACALANRMKSCKAKKMVLGVSGGLDSTMALIICAECCKLMNRSTKSIVAVSMPGFGTGDRTRDNSIAIAKCFNTMLKQIPITDAVIQHFKDIGHDPEVTDVVYENSQARERTQILMDIANQCSGIVIGTGDLSEIALGWCTYNGDQMSMYAVNASIPKTLMRCIIRNYAENSEPELAERLIDICDTPVSPELVPGKQNTEDIIGSYELHDFFLWYFMRYGATPEKLYLLARKAFIRKHTPQRTIAAIETFFNRFLTSQFKRSAMPDSPDVTGMSLASFDIPSDVCANVWKSSIENLKSAIKLN